MPRLESEISASEAVRQEAFGTSSTEDLSCYLPLEPRRVHKFDSDRMLVAFVDKTGYQFCDPEVQNAFDSISAKLKSYGVACGEVTTNGEGDTTAEYSLKAIIQQDGELPDSGQRLTASSLDELNGKVNIHLRDSEGITGIIPFVITGNSSGEHFGEVHLFEGKIFELPSGLDQPHEYLVGNVATWIIQQEDN